MPANKVPRRLISASRSLRRAAPSPAGCAAAGGEPGASPVPTLAGAGVVLDAGDVSTEAAVRNTGRWGYCPFAAGWPLAMTSIAIAGNFQTPLMPSPRRLLA